MKAQRSAGRLRLLRSLILGSVVLLLLFLGYWLKGRYQSERTGLEKDLTAKLDATRQELSDSLLMQKVLGTQTSSGEVNAYRITGAHASSIQIRMGPELRNRAIKSIAPEGQIKMTEPKQELILHREGDTLPKELIRSLGSIIAKTGMFSDSMHVLLTVGDSSTLRRSFQQKLLAGGYHFMIGREDKRARTGSLKAAPILLQENPQRMITVSGYQSFLLRKILPDILFSLLLLGITSGAFWLTLRSLRQQMKLSLIRNELVSNMSHELKTPVATVKVALEALGDADVMENRRTARDYVAIATLEITRLELLINQTLHTSLLEEGRLLMQLRPADICALATEVFQASLIRFRQEGATLLLDCEGKDFNAPADRLHLQGVLLNVLDNALKYGGAKVTTSMTLREDSETIKISIRDNGPGIPDAYLRQVFDKFFRVPAHNLHNVKGYGLGLSYARQVMQQHGGAISASNNAGGGCTFFITIPKQRV